MKLPGVCNVLCERLQSGRSRGVFALIAIASVIWGSNVACAEEVGVKPAIASLVLSRPQQVFEVSVADQIESLPVVFDFQLENKSASNFTDLNGSVDCTCIRVTGVQGERIDVAKSLNFRIAISPRRGDFVRTLTVRARDGTMKVDHLFTVRLKCSCIPPAALEKQYFLTNEIGASHVLVVRANSNRIKLDSDVKFGITSFVIDKCTTHENGDLQIHFSVNQPYAKFINRNGDLTASIKIPFHIDDHEKQFVFEETVTILAKQRIEVAPRTLRLTTSEGVTSFRLVIADYRETTDASLGKLNFVLKDASGQARGITLSAVTERLSGNRFTVTGEIFKDESSKLSSLTQMEILDPKTSEIFRSIPIDTGL